MNNKELLKRICDRTQPVDWSLIGTLLDWWRFDLYTRHPGPAYFDDGQLVMTDLDLACFISALAERHAVINLPTYKRRRAKTVKPGERAVSSANRHGKIMGLVANKEVFSFGALINDANVMRSSPLGDEVGAFRNFLLTNFDGNFWEGWDRIEFMPTAQENDFLVNRQLWTEDTLFFQNFAHPNRWISFYGSYYFITKALMQRLEEESSFLRDERSRLLALLPGTPGNTTPVQAKAKANPKAAAEEGVPCKVMAFVAEVDVPMTGSYAPITMLAAGDIQCASLESRLRLYAQALQPLRFATRASELAFVKHHGAERRPAWLKTAYWSDHVQPGKRTTWQRLALPFTKDGSRGDVNLALRYRLWQKTERIAPGSPAPQLAL